MEIINKFDDVELSLRLLEKIRENSNKQINIMEVCGTHTRSIYKYGINSLLPEEINLISGPGCPICVTPSEYIDNAVYLSQNKDVIITTFGDMMRVPGSICSLSSAKTKGSDIRIIYSPFDSLKTAEENKRKEVIFLGAGFETTIPSIGLSIIDAEINNIKNYSVLCSLKTMPVMMKSLFYDKDVKIDGFICPGHVASVIGAEPFRMLSEELNVPMVICGFKRTEILGGILAIINMINCKKVRCENLYKGFVKEYGNSKAKDVFHKVFIKSDGIWRGIGTVPGSGVKINENYMKYDAEVKFEITNESKEKVSGCICGEILKGIKKPEECGLFGRVCTSEFPVGPCMVSKEGTCGIVYENLVDI